MKKAKRIFSIILGAVFVGMAISLFIEPNNIVPGGINGIAIMISKFVNVGVGTISFIINIPIIIVGLVKLGKRFFASTLFALASTSAAIDFFAEFEPVTDDLLAGALAGGALTAAGIALIFMQEATTGGVDIIVRLVKLKKPHMKTGEVFLVLDGAVALASGLVFGSWELIIYSLLTIGISSVVMNFLLYGSDEAKLLIIVCNKTEKVMQALTQTLKVGASILQGQGGYTQQERTIIMCAVRKQSLYKAKELVHGVDSSAFLIVTSATSIYGEGFKSYEDAEI